MPRNNAEPSSIPATEKHFIYPRLGQSEKQQADDQYQCNRWAVGQTGFDPTDTSSRGADAGGASNRLNEYWRAMGACLEGRGYTIK